MENICPNCHVLCTDICPKCGRRRGLRAVDDGEPVLLMILEPTLALLAEPVLEDSGIPYSCPGTLTSMLTNRWGSGFESKRYYVPYRARAAARALMTDAFGESPEIMRALHEFDLNEDRIQGE